ncbi:MAG: cupin domain-containing protein [Clostridiales Family XIII bacterium]|nr:cupin domain-containing protein [Clostridiales Family XIII bacterium]
MTDLGSRIKELRKQNNMTLRVLAEKAHLSGGFLSQLERGLTTVAVDSLQEIAAALNVDLSYFFKKDVWSEEPEQDYVKRSYDLTVSFSESDRYVHQYLAGNAASHRMFPEIILLMPEERWDDYENSRVFRHHGEEFIYILEGMLTMRYDHKVHKLYPGDSFLFHSSVPHSWHNSTNQITKILVVRHPNPFSPSPTQEITEEGASKEGG